MKILFLSNHGIPTAFGRQDYVNGCTLHGLRSLFGADVVDYPKVDCMYRSAESVKPLMYGRGFTIFATLSDIEIDRVDIENKIQYRYFDLIVYGQVTRSSQFLDLVLKHYPRDRVVFIDSEDEQLVHQQLYNLKTIYFKRESAQRYTHPITFCVPKDKILTTKPIKLREISNIIPGSAYSFTDEQEYYKEYQSSNFAITHKKAGWDCMRHYEIMMNRCIPYMRDIDQLPERTMVHFPKVLIRETMRMYDSRLLSVDRYWEQEEIMHNHLLEHLTTEAMAKYILDVCRKAANI